MQPVSAAPADRSHEFKAVGLLALGCGMVGLDRFVISPLFPVMAKDLGLTYSDLGLISGVLSLAWGVAASFGGGLADRLGNRRVIVPAMVVFSLLAGTTGFATGLISLLLVRGVMGLAEGTYMPAALSAAADASPARRMGMNTGLLQMTLGLFGFGIGPVIATQVLRFLPSWHAVFAIVALPGLILSVLLQFTLRGPRSANLKASQGPETSGPGAVSTSRSVAWHRLLRQRNVLCATWCAAWFGTAMVMFAAFLPSYLVDYLKLDMQSMGFVLSAVGLGSMMGMVGLSALSDRFGCRRVLILAATLLLGTLTVLRQTDADPAKLFGLIFLVALLGAGSLGISVGPLALRSVPPAFAATAAGLVMGFSEMIAGAGMPVVAGAAAQSQGIQVIFPIAITAAFLALLGCVFGIHETRPVAPVVPASPVDSNVR